MDVKAYISSGILEEYSLGVVSDQERREVECLSKIYPEIKEALGQMEGDLEHFAKGYATEPPPELRASIMDAVSETKQESNLRALDAEPKSASIDKESEISATSRPSGASWLIAAAILGFAFGVWQFYQNQNKSLEIALLDQKVKDMNVQYEGLEMQLAELNEGMDEMYSPMLQKVVMKPMMEGIETDVSVFWNMENGEVKLDPSKLPELTESEQYQMWVIRDGVPVDMGIIPKEMDGALMASEKTMKGEAFTLTIEPLGGQAEPSLDRLVVLGYTV